MKGLSKIALFIVSAGVFALIANVGYVRWRKNNAIDQQVLTESKSHALRSVIKSPFGNKDMRDEIASEYLGRTVTTEECEWFEYPLWRGTPKNPNWFSSIKDFDGFRVICRTDARDEEHSPLALGWDLDGDFRVTGIRWDYSTRDW